jgi:hypothetical protein
VGSIATLYAPQQRLLGEKGEGVQSGTAGNNGRVNNPSEVVLSARLGIEQPGGQRSFRRALPPRCLWLALETRVLDARANCGWMVRSLADFPDRYKGINTDKMTGEMAGKTCCLAISVPLTCPRGDGGYRLGRKSRRDERLRPWGGTNGMRRRDRRAPA